MVFRPATMMNALVAAFTACATVVFGLIAFGPVPTAHAASSGGSVFDVPGVSQFALSRDGKTIYTVENSGVRQYDVASGNEKTPYFASSVSGTRGIAVSPTSDELYVGTLADQGRVDVFDTTQQCGEGCGGVDPVRSLPLPGDAGGSAPGQLLVSPDGRTLYGTGMGQANVVWAMDTSNGKAVGSDLRLSAVSVASQNTINHMPLALSADGGTLVVQSGSVDGSSDSSSPGFVVVDTASWKVRDRVSVKNAPGTFAVNADGTVIWYTDVMDNSFHRVSADGSDDHTVTSGDMSSGVTQLKTDPDGRALYASMNGTGDGASGVSALDPSDLKRTASFPTDGDIVLGLAVSADGSVIAAATVKSITGNTPTVRMRTTSTGLKPVSASADGAAAGPAGGIDRMTVFRGVLVALIVADAVVLAVLVAKRRRVSAHVIP
ncbi:YncE family protein [Bifidobacterium platyrrhinorum]|uniref:Beta-propeller fold lactonase family protein n=1 Tax=Bifidobacterium platyrrhinorum TaxID=2661628 RepID=A0A6L9SQ24_9BIFI|nr:hypothetical protein [Bifidobacterium platyrrhinorum]NEG54610.1 hypothetical protein [Bifidobacterium platyrrhinorum]